MRTRNILLLGVFLCSLFVCPLVQAEGIVYLFGDKSPKPFAISINGSEKFVLEGKILKRQGSNTIGGVTEEFNTYSNVVKKIIFSEDGQYMISFDMSWFGKPYHDEIVIDITDGDIQYIVISNSIKGLKFKPLKESDGLKKLKKAEEDTKKTIIKEDYIYE